MRLHITTAFLGTLLHTRAAANLLHSKLLEKFWLILILLLVHKQLIKGILIFQILTGRPNLNKKKCHGIFSVLLSGWRSYIQIFTKNTSFVEVKLHLTGIASSIHSSITIWGKKHSSRVNCDFSNTKQISPSKWRCRNLEWASRYMSS